MISGDHPETVAALASQAGMPFSGATANGLELESAGDAELDESVQTASIFGRVSPNTKARIVNSLRRSGHYAAMDRRLHR